MGSTAVSGHTDSATVTRLENTSFPWMNTPVCLTLQGSLLLICEHKALRTSYGKTDQELPSICILFFFHYFRDPTLEKKPVERTDCRVSKGLVRCSWHSLRRSAHGLGIIVCGVPLGGRTLWKAQPHGFMKWCSLLKEACVLAHSVMYCFWVDGCE